MSKIIWASTTKPTYATDRETGAVLPLDAECSACREVYDYGGEHICLGEPLNGRA